VLTNPPSVDSISMSRAREDHVSTGGFAARKALIVVENVRPWWPSRSWRRVRTQQQERHLDAQQSVTSGSVSLNSHSRLDSNAPNNRNTTSGCRAPCNSSSSGFQQLSCTSTRLSSANAFVSLRRYSNDHMHKNHIFNQSNTVNPRKVACLTISPHNSMYTDFALHSGTGQNK
jgi:hypothetical protein